MHKFLRDWSLPIAMIAGVLMYLSYTNIAIFDSTHAVAAAIISIMQPALIFLMLFITFCKVRIKELRPSKWHFIMLSLQIASFTAISLTIAFFTEISATTRIMLEAAMLCLLCPTATAAAVITAKLGGNSASLISYTMLINMAVAIVAPIFLTFSHPIDGVSIDTSFIIILSKVFPLLLLPLICAEGARHIVPGIHRWLTTKGRNLPFYIWLIALSLAIAMTARAIAHAHLPLLTMAGIAAVSLMCCLMQFYIGRRIGARYSDPITGGQAMGQKNTVFAIWLAYTFLTPVTAIAGGFYSIWHNLVNTWQLQKKQGL